MVAPHCTTRPCHRVKTKQRGSAVVKGGGGTPAAACTRSRFLTELMAYMRIDKSKMMNDVIVNDW